MGQRYNALTGRYENDPGTDGRFWLVWTPAPHVNNPQARHLSRWAGVAEAKRLASLNPGTEFFVAAVTGRAVSPPLPTVAWTELKS